MSYYISLFGTWIVNQIINNCLNCGEKLNIQECLKPKPHIRFQACGFCFNCKKHYWTIR